ncbi:MAG: dual specificity protein phosphatase family protein [Planctomycetota bacterium]
MFKALIARAIYYPTLGYNFLLGRILKRRNWWDPINDHLILGARPMRGDPQRFHEMGVTGVVNTCEEMQGPIAEYEKLGIEQLWIPTTDFHHPSQESVSSGAEFIEKHRQGGGRTYVHCKAGRARSGTVVLWWLVRFGGMTPEEAQDVILKSRPHANPNLFKRPVIQDLWFSLNKQPSETNSESD